MKELKTRDELIEKLESNNRQEQEKPVLDENIRREIRREVSRQSFFWWLFFGDKK